MTNNPFVSVIVLSLNGAEYIGQCLSTLTANDYTNFEVIVVNNGSTDATPDIVARDFPHVRLINLPRNLGFAGGINVGLRASRGDILIPLNDDTICTPDLIRNIIQPILEEPNIGIVGCKIMYPDRNTIQHAGGCILPNGSTRHLGYKEEDRGQHDIQRDVDYITGCIMAIPRHIFEKFGLFDDRYYPIYYEEVEFAVRIRKAGYRVVYTPKAVLYHLESMTEVAGSSRFLYRFNKSRWRFVLKNFSLSQIILAVRYELKYLRNMDYRIEGLPMLRAYFSTLIRLPIILYDRKYRFITLK